MFELDEMMNKEYYTHDVLCQISDKMKTIMNTNTAEEDDLQDITAIQFIIAATFANDVSHYVVCFQEDLQTF